MNKIIIALFVLLSAPLVSAQYCTYLLEEIGMEEGMSVPSYIPYKNERIQIQDFNGENQGSVITEDGSVTSITCNEIENPTYIIQVDNNQTINDLFYSEQPMSTFDTLKDEGNVILEGQSFGKQLKKTATYGVIQVMSWFGM